MTEILYKYRSLENFRNFVDVILNKRLYAANYKELNDPMEGQYLYGQGELAKSLRQKISEEKSVLRICSLSKINNHELMWTHYTKGQTGVVVGVKIDTNLYTVRQIEYTGLTYIKRTNYSDQTAIDILSHKLEVWDYEEEERVFTTGKDYVSVDVVEVITGRSMTDIDYCLVNELITKIDPSIKVIKASEIMN